MAHEKSRLRAHEAALFIGQDELVDQSSLATKLRRFFDGLLQRSTKDFFMRRFDQVHGEGLGFSTKISEHYSVNETTARVCLENTRLAVAKGLEGARVSLSSVPMMTLRLAFPRVSAMLVWIPVAREHVGVSTVFSNDLAQILSIT